MNAQEAFFAFYTLLLGLGMAGLLTGFAGVVRRHRTREIGTVGAMLGVLIIFEFLTAWSGAARFVTVDDARVAALLLPFLTGACYVLASVLLFPDFGEFDEIGSVGDYIRGQVRTLALLLFAANALLIALEFPDVWESYRHDPNYLTFYLPYNGGILACYAVMIAAPRRRIAALAMVALLLLYTGIFAIRRV